MQKLSLTNKYTPYPKYKDSGVEWLGEIPEHWNILKLQRLYQKLKRTGFENEELLSVYRDRGVIIKSSRSDNHNNASENLSTYQLVEVGDLAINKMKAWQGSLAISPHRGIVSPAYYVCRPLSQNDPKFIHYLLRSKLYIKQYEQISGGVRNNQWDLRYEMFRKIEATLPPTEEQERIAQFLDEQIVRIDEIIAKKERLIKLLKEKRTTTINHAVTKGLDSKVSFAECGIEWIGEIPKGWKVKRLGLVTKISASNVNKLTEEGQKVVRVCNYVDVYKNEYITKDLNFVHASATASQINKFSLLSGDILLTKDSETANDIGVPAFVVEDIKGTVVGYHIYQARVSDKSLLPEYVFRYLQSQFANAWFENKARGVTRFGLGSHGVKSLPVLVPTYNEQKEIIAFIKHQTDIINSAKDKIEKSILLLQELKSSLISHAVTGKIKV